MKTKEKHLFLLLLLFLSACSGSEVIEKFPPVKNKYDSSRSKEVTAMKPLTGRIDDNFVIEGNLGNNVEDMRVYFDERKAVLLRTDGQTLHGIVPKQPDGYNKITVVLGTDSIITDIEFRYRQNQVISTIAGNFDKRLHWSGNKQDGSLTEATFTYTEGLTVVAGNNILVSDAWACLRLVSQEDEKVVSITGNWGHKFGDGAVNKARDLVYFFHFDARTLWRSKREDGWVPSLVRSSMPEFTGTATGLTFGADERYLYMREHNGKFGRFDLETEGIPFEVLLETTPETDNKTKICYCPVSQCFYYSSYSHHGINKVWQDKTTGQWKEERYAGYNGAGLGEGNRLTEARFNQPMGVCADRDGNLYVCCVYSKSIMKVWLKSGYVEHVAGMWDDQWNQLPPVNGKPLQSRLHDPYCIVMDDEDNFILGCTNDGEIRKYAIE